MEIDNESHTSTVEELEKFVLKLLDLKVLGTVSLVNWCGAIGRSWWTVLSWNCTQTVCPSIPGHSVCSNIMLFQMDSRWNSFGLRAGSVVATMVSDQRARSLKPRLSRTPQPQSWIMSVQ